MLSRLRPYAVVLLVWAFVSAAPSGQTRPPQVQSAGITIEGSVVDPSLAVLPGVTVTLERDGNVVATILTGTDGIFRFTAVTPGQYTVRARLTGFKVLARVLTIHDRPAAAAAEFGLLLRDGQSPLDRWQDLTRRIRVLPVSTDTAADRQALADLVDLAAGLRKLSGPSR